jgi:curved DNA-binding protein CbpA
MEFHYKILKISNNATYKEIKYAYRCLSKINHPDKVFTGTEKQKIEAGETFKQIKKAYDNLINPHSRKKYDDKLNKYWEKEQSTVSDEKQSDSYSTSVSDPHLKLSKKFFAFVINIRNSSSVSDGFTISNTGGGTLKGSIKTDKKWLKVSHSYIYTNGQEISFVIDISSLDYRPHIIGTIEVQSNGGNETVYVTLRVRGKYFLRYDVRYFFKYDVPSFLNNVLISFVVFWKLIGIGIGVLILAIMLIVFGTDILPEKVSKERNVEFVSSNAIQNVFQTISEKISGDWIGYVGNTRAKLTIHANGNGFIIYDNIKEFLTLNIYDSENDLDYEKFILRSINYENLHENSNASFSLKTFNGELSKDCRSISGNYIDTAGNKGDWSVTKHVYTQKAPRSGTNLLNSDDKKNTSKETDQTRGVKVIRPLNPNSVFVTKYSKIYHKSICPQLNKENLMEFTSSQKAQEAGGIPCKYCNSMIVK